MDKISLQGKCSIRNIQGQMVRISLQEEKQYLKYVITIWYLQVNAKDLPVQGTKTNIHTTIPVGQP